MTQEIVQSKKYLALQIQLFFFCSHNYSLFFWTSESIFTAIINRKPKLRKIHYRYNILKIKFKNMHSITHVLRHHNSLEGISLTLSVKADTVCSGTFLSINRDRKILSSVLLSPDLCETKSKGAILTRILKQIIRKRYCPNNTVKWLSAGQETFH